MTIIGTSLLSSGGVLPYRLAVETEDLKKEETAADESETSDETNNETETGETTCEITGANIVSNYMRTLSLIPCTSYTISASTSAEEDEAVEEEEEETAAAEEEETDTSDEISETTYSSSSCSFDDMYETACEFITSTLETVKNALLATGYYDADVVESIFDELKDSYYEKAESLCRESTVQFFVERNQTSLNSVYTGLSWQLDDTGMYTWSIDGAELVSVFKEKYEKISAVKEEAEEWGEISETMYSSSSCSADDAYTTACELIESTLETFKTAVLATGNYDADTVESVFKILKSRYTGYAQSQCDDFDSYAEFGITSNGYLTIYDYQKYLAYSDKLVTTDIVGVLGWQVDDTGMYTWYINGLALTTAFEDLYEEYEEYEERIGGLAPSESFRK